jgi:TatA/E family protein of Tat protein translocase
MVNVGPLEIIVVAIIALIVLGPQRLPEVARSVGRGMREFRSALSDAGGRDDEDDEDDEDFDDEIVDEIEPPSDHQNDAESSESSSSSRDLV